MNQDEELGYDLDSLFRFINTVMLNRPSDDQGYLKAQENWRRKNGIPEKTVTPDEIAAAMALEDVILNDVSLVKLFKLKLRPSEADKRKCLNSPIYSMVLAALNNEFPDNGLTQRQNAVNEISKYLNISERRAETYYADIKDNAEISLKTFKKMFMNAGWGEFKAMRANSDTKEDQIKALVGKQLTYNQKIMRVMEITGKSRMDAQQLHKSLALSEQ